MDTRTKQYRDFNKNVIDVRSHSIRDAIKRNYLALFKHPRYKTTFKQGKNIETLQKNVALCGQLYIVSVQNRDGDLAEFLAHEIQSFSHSLSNSSNLGMFHLPSTKSDLLRCHGLHGQPYPHLTDDCKVMGGAVIVHCLLTPLVLPMPMQTRCDIHSLSGEPATECHELGCCMRHRHPGQFD